MPWVSTSPSKTPPPLSFQAFTPPPPPPPTFQIQNIQVVKVFQVDFFVMTEKNIFVYTNSLSLNILDFSYL